ncbi:hypothetical protein [Cellulomonas fengjieae]|uniref:Uncharacterized protein n=1 Tax=Cellulomonas fengjieae TaxID=2819978 RepID=A0ABS3SJP8_9CELL|nr:hypothetical protein [Cellulomonas fengjieae]MBO3085176.1 hypothetical protein [Cellulomonas fengjieae]QVI66252.1 hypothetical protein KG102_01080 [Cellulomonas fengjieae]
MVDDHSNAAERRKIAIEALGPQLSGDPNSAAGRLGRMLTDSRSMIVSADIDGLVSAAMLASVAKNYKIVAFSVLSGEWLVHPSVATRVPDDAFGIDLFSTRFDSVSNHIIKWGDRQPRAAGVAAAFEAWDSAVDAAANVHLVASPTMWAGTQAGYDEPGKAYSARYKYPLGTAQLLLAMLEASGNAPKFYDRTYLPWLVANCDGGIATYTRYAANARVWWPVLAGAVGPGSLTAQVFDLVDRMRPHDFLDAVHRLDRERAQADPAWLNDAWKLASTEPATITRTLRWLTDLTGWADPVLGGIGGIAGWLRLPTKGSAQVYYDSDAPSAKALARNAASWVKTKDNPALAVSLIRNGVTALNANFLVGGQSGSRFNWVGSW